MRVHYVAKALRCVEFKSVLQMLHDPRTQRLALMAAGKRPPTVTPSGRYTDSVALLAEGRHDEQTEEKA